uniref:Uncharacterized protein n=1 Tax=Timema shepardi TaxID=629360 RepID=A0A7R9G5W0_TIMSH|nr:unnamed protein product [Timema shepardi]
MTHLEMDQGLRAKLLRLGADKHKEESQPRLTLKDTRLTWTCVTVVFQLPVFTVELRSDLGQGEQGLVDLSFQDFCVQYDRSHSYETNIEMSLRAIIELRSQTFSVLSCSEPFLVTCYKMSLRAIIELRCQTVSVLSCSHFLLLVTRCFKMSLRAIIELRCQTFSVLSCSHFLLLVTRCYKMSLRAIIELRSQTFSVLSCSEPFLVTCYKMSLRAIIELRCQTFSVLSCSEPFLVTCYKMSLRAIIELRCQTFSVLSCSEPFLVTCYKMSLRAIIELRCQTFSVLSCSEPFLVTCYKMSLRAIIELRCQTFSVLSCSEPFLVTCYKMSLRAIIELRCQTFSVLSCSEPFLVTCYKMSLRAIIELRSQTFSVLSCSEPFLVTCYKMSLRALLMEDLLREPDSKHRCIVVSSAPTKTAAPRPVVRAPEFVSKSCPNLIGHPPLSNLRGSLPDHLETEVIYGTFNAGRMRHVGKTVEYPCTPPPSPRLTGSPQRFSKEDNLVHINVTLVDRDAPNLASHYNSVHRSVTVNSLDVEINVSVCLGPSLSDCQLSGCRDQCVHRSVTVNFNSLDVVVNVESWVVVLDFFGIGSSSRSTEDRIHSVQQTSTAVEKSTENEIVFNSEMDVEVRSLTLVLNHPEYEVARANISHLTVRVNTRHSDQSIEGRLGSMSLMDLTHHGQLYREKFTLSGLEALSFTMIRNTRPNLDSSPPFDSHLKIEMSSVLYVHTSRFVAEIQEFFHSFSRLQDVVESIRAATAGNDSISCRVDSDRMPLHASIFPDKSDLPAETIAPANPPGFQPLPLRVHLPVTIVVLCKKRSSSSQVKIAVQPLMH